MKQDVVLNGRDQIRVRLESEGVQVVPYLVRLAGMLTVPLFAGLEHDRFQLAWSESAFVFENLAL